MPTPKQEKFVNKMLENVNSPKPKSLTKIGEESGYGKIAKQPSRIIRSRGVQKILKKYGITKDKVAELYKDDLDALKEFKKNNPEWFAQASPETIRKLTMDLAKLTGLENKEGKHDKRKLKRLLIEEYGE